MKGIKINPKKDFFKWGPVNFKIVYASIFFKEILLATRKYYKWPWPPALLIFEKGKSLWIVEEEKLREYGLNYFKKYFLNLDNYKKLWGEWEEWIREHNIFFKKIEKINLKNLNNKEFSKLLKDFQDINKRFWVIVHVPEIANWGGEYLLQNKLEKLFGKEANNYLEILSAPIKYSFFQEEELDLLKVINQKELKEHAQNFHWILNSYGGNRILDEKFFKEKLKELTESNPLTRLRTGRTEKIKEIENIIKNNKTRKEDLIKKLKLDKDLVLVSNQLSQSIWWQDFRKGYIWRMQYFWDLFLAETSKRSGWKFSSLQWCFFDELLSIVSGKKLSEVKIKSRSNNFAIYTEDEKKRREIYGKENIKKLLNTYDKLDIKNIKEIKGLLVSKGNSSFVKGRVMITKDPFRDVKKFKKGDILVTGMTSPEYIVVMRKVKAIITDHGGMTCHAAIVSRELGIPCLVDTKVATKVLKNGDEIEIDINKGLIKI